MILTRLGPDATFYRAVTPRWAHLPESGAGAAAVGGRFNRPGVEARYLAESAEGALSEYQQVTLCPYSAPNDGRDNWYDRQVNFPLGVWWYGERVGPMVSEGA